MKPMERKMRLDISQDDKNVGYLSLPDHPGAIPGVVQKTVCLRELIGDYSGPDVNLDFAENNLLIGIEIVG